MNPSLSTSNESTGLRQSTLSMRRSSSISTINRRRLCLVLCFELLATSKRLTRLGDIMLSLVE